MDKYVRFVYCLTKHFPKEEKYGSASQLRRSSLSVILNYIEGYARRRPAVRLNFLETSFGSLKESKYLIYLSYKESYISSEDYQKAMEVADEIAAMLWTEISHLDK